MSDVLPEYAQKEDGGNSMGGKIILKVISIAAAVLVVAAAIVIAGPQLLGWRPMVVLSGSMEPVYPVGSMVYVRKVSPQEVKVGEPIAFYLEDGSTVITHRVVRIDTQKQAFYTKGDANQVEDGTATPYSRLIGTPAFDIPKVGYLASYLGTASGRIIMITILVCILLIAFLPELLMKSGKTALKADGKEKGDNV